MSDAPRKRGRPTGTKRVHPDRDRIAHATVEWVMQKTGLGLGRGSKEEPADADACIAAAWILSGYQRYTEYFPEINAPFNPLVSGQPQTGVQVGTWYAKWEAEASNYRYLRVHVLIAWDYFQSLFAGVVQPNELKLQLRRMSRRAIHNAYRDTREKQNSRASVWESVNQAERARRILTGHLPVGDFFLDHDENVPPSN